MNVSELMTAKTRTCSIDDNLATVAQVMSEHDCGCIPLVDDAGRVTGIVTDRDICLAAYNRDQPLSKIPATYAAARDVVTVQPDDTIERAEALMRQHEVRRLPVVDDQGRPIGLLSIDDLVHGVHVERSRSGLTPDTVLLTLAAIGEVRG